MGARLLRYASYPASLHGYRGREKLTLSRRVATIWVVISLAVAVLIGVIGLAMSDVGALKTLTGSDSETIIVQIADLLSKHGILPALLAGTIRCRHSCLYNVHGRLTAFGCILPP